VQNVSDGKQYAAKFGISSDTGGYTSLLQEKTILYKLQNCINIPSMKCFRETIPLQNGQQRDVLIMDLLGDSLNRVFKNNNKKLSIKTTCKIGQKMITADKNLHSNGYTHCDIKPDNFCINSGEEQLENCELKIIDFGCSRLWWNYRENKHIECKTNC